MKTFVEFQYHKQVGQIRNEILHLASKLNLEQMKNIFESTFDLKSDDPNSSGYNQLVQSLDGFINTVGQNGKNLLDMLNKLKQKLTVQSNQPLQNNPQGQVQGQAQSGNNLLQDLKQKGYTQAQINAYIQNQMLPGRK